MIEHSNRCNIKILTLYIIFFISIRMQAQPPNIIYIMTDDMGYADLGCFGGKKISTPALDKLAAQGIKFMHSYSAAPVCTPTRVAFMTGRYPARTPVGLMEPLTPNKKDSTIGLTKDYPSIATLLKDAGYSTALIGKWHLGFLAENKPYRNGIEYFFGFISGAADYISHKGDGRKHDLYENDKLVYPAGYITDLFTLKSIEYIKRPHKKPFFLSLNYTAPHWPWQGPGDLAYEDSVNFRHGGSPEIYTAMMKSLDDGIGQIMQVLEDEKLSENTIVIFTNDNGGESYSDNGPFAKGKMTLWEGGIRVPAIVRWPGKIQAGIATQQNVITMDWTATILAVASAKPNPEFALDGIDLMPVCTGNQKETERTFYWRTFQRAKQKALRQGNWKYLQVENEEYLFDLMADPGEKNNLKELHSEIFNRLKNEFSKWEQTVLQPIPL